MKLKYPAVLLALASLGFTAFFVVPGICQSGRTATTEEVFIVNYLANKSFKLQFSPKAAFQLATGTGEIELKDNNVANIKAEFKKLKSVFNIGGRYSTYVLWAVYDDGSAQNLGEVETNSKPQVSDGSLSLQIPVSGSFGLILTAEPHGKVTLPSTIALVAGPPVGNKAILAGTRKVQCVLSDVDNSGAVEKFAKKKDEERYRKQSPIVLGAEYAIQMATEAGAETYASDEINAAVSSFEKLKPIVADGKTEQIEQAARTTIGLAADATKKALLRKQQAREEQAKVQADRRISGLSGDLEGTRQENKNLKKELELAVNDRDKLLEEVTTSRIQNQRLDTENEKLKFQSDKDKKALEDLRTQLLVAQKEIDRLRGPKEFADDRANLEELLKNYGRVQPLAVGVGLQLTLADTFWMNPDSDALTTERTAEIDLLAQQLAGYRYFVFEINSYVVNNEDLVGATQFADKRAKTLETRLTNGGILTERLKTKAIPAYQAPVAGKAGKKTPAAVNRVEIIIRVPD